MPGGSHLSHGRKPGNKSATKRHKRRKEKDRVTAGMFFCLLCHFRGKSFYEGLCGGWRLSGRDANNKTTTMKKSILILASAFAMAASSTVFGQVPPPPVRLTSVGVNLMTAEDAPKLTKFTLDFPGGTPKQLVAAIEKAMSKPLHER